MNGVSVSSELNIGELLSKSWDIFTKNVGLLIGAVVLVGLILIVGSWISFGLAGIVLTGPLMYGLSLLCLRLVRGESADFNLVFSGFQRFLPSFMAGLLISLFAFIGTILCILPGLFVTIIYMLTYFYMVDQKLDFWPAMEASRKAVMDNFSKWFVLWLVVVLLNFAGGLICGIGQLVTGPLSFLMIAEAYNRINSGSGEVYQLSSEG